MRRMPQLMEGQRQQKMTTTFRGYNHNQIILDGEMYDMQNLSGDQFPMMTIRQKRMIRLKKTIMLKGFLTTFRN